MFLHMNIRTFVTILSRKAQCNFPKMRGGGGQKPFGTFPKIHLILLTWPVPKSLTFTHLSKVLSWPSFLWMANLHITFPAGLKGPSTIKVYLQIWLYNRVWVDFLCVLLLWPFKGSGFHWTWKVFLVHICQLGFVFGQLCIWVCYSPDQISICWIF